MSNNTTKAKIFFRNTKDFFNYVIHNIGLNGGFQAIASLVAVIVTLVMTQYTPSILLWSLFSLLIPMGVDAFATFRKMPISGKEHSFRNGYIITLVFLSISVIFGFIMFGIQSNIKGFVMPNCINIIMEISLFFNPAVCCFKYLGAGVIEKNRSIL